MKATGIERLGCFDGVVRPQDVSDVLLLRAGRQIVNGGKMKKMVNLVLQVLPVRFADTQITLGQITGDRQNPVCLIAPE